MGTSVRKSSAKASSNGQSRRSVPSRHASTTPISAQQATGKPTSTRASCADDPDVEDLAPEDRSRIARDHIAGLWNCGRRSLVIVPGAFERANTSWRCCGRTGVKRRPRPILKAIHGTGAKSATKRSVAAAAVVASRRAGNARPPSKTRAGEQRSPPAFTGGRKK